MNKQTIPAFFHITAATFPRAMYCVIFQAGGDDDDISLTSVETSGITPIDCPLCDTLIEERVDLKKHFDEVMPQVEQILTRAFLNAVKERTRKDKDEEDEA